jgi:predicted metal-dependent hydrolase
MALEAHDLTMLRRGLGYCRAGDYFAAHDAWEEVWQGLRGRRRLFWQAMIQLVVGAYHYTNGNLRGCRGQWQKALQKCHDLAPTGEAVAAAPVVLLGDLLRAELAAVERGEDPLPHLATFATSVMSETWFAFE